MKQWKRNCPVCHGAGGEVDVILNDGTGPWEECGFCKGTRIVGKQKLYCQVLGWLSVEARTRVKHKRVEYALNS